MEDSKIIELYFSRHPDAIPATSRKYGRYLSAIAMNILHNREDTEECVSDTYLKTWNTIPPHKPEIFCAYLGRIARNLSLHRFQYNTAQKRGGGQTPAIMEELAECIPSTDNIQQEMDRAEIVCALNDFLGALSEEKRCIFLRRYWYFDSIRSIARRFCKTENNISVILNRLRRELRTHLIDRGIEL